MSTNDQNTVSQINEKPPGTKVLQTAARGATGAVVGSMARRVLGARLGGPPGAVISAKLGAKLGGSAGGVGSGGGIT